MKNTRAVRLCLSIAVATVALAGCPSPAGPNNEPNEPPTATLVDYSVSGAGITAVNGDYRENGVNEGRPRYAQVGGSYLVYYALLQTLGDYRWAIAQAVETNEANIAYFTSTQPSTPPAADWQEGGTGDSNVPTLARAAILGTLISGATLTGNYAYSDPDGDPEGSSTYRWYRFGTSTATTGGAQVGSARDYVVDNEDTGQFLRFEVTPKDNRGLGGNPVLSGPVAIP